MPIEAPLLTTWQVVVFFIALAIVAADIFFAPKRRALVCLAGAITLTAGVVAAAYLNKDGETTLAIENGTLVHRATLGGREHETRVTLNGEKDATVLADKVSQLAQGFTENPSLS